MRTNLKRVAALVGGATALSVVAALAPLATNVAGAVQLAAGAASSGNVTLTPATGTSATSVIMAPPTGADCPGSGADNFRYHTYITPLANDPSQLDYNATGTPAPLPTANLRTAAGAQLKAISPAIGNNFLAQQTFSFQSGAFSAANLPAGQYRVGFACTTPDGQLAGSPATPGGPTDGFLDVEEYWATAITITASAGAGPQNFNWAAGITPGAPVVSALTAGDGTLSGTVSIPATTDAFVGSLNATATPQGGGAAVTGTIGGALVFPLTAAVNNVPVSFSGLANGTTYDVVVTSINPAASTSSPPESGTPAIGLQPAVTGLTAPADVGACAVSFNPSTSLQPISNYRVDVTTGGAGGVPIAGSPFTIPTGGPYTLDLSPTSLLTPITLATEEHTIVVTPQHTPPVTASSATTTCIPQSDQNIVQQVSVVRPPGALVLTQRCGVYGGLPAFTGTDGFPGFNTTLSQGGIPQPPYTANGVFPGDEPTLDPGTITPGADESDPATYTPGLTIDPDFGEYPNPPNDTPDSYPTYCGLDLGVASLVTQGNLAGYYQADGNLNQVTVLDTRDGDPGWKLQGVMSEFSDGASPTPEAFEGSYLGWVPRVNNVLGSSDVRSDVVAGDGRVLTGVAGGYTQVVTAGATVLPGKDLATDSGLGNGEDLAVADQGEGLGAAILDARILLLIPPSVPAGTYDGELTLSFY